MQPSSPIYFLDMPFAQEGDKTIIPAETATAEGRATQAEGFPAVTQLPIASGGIAPNRWDFNGMFFLLSQLAHWEQSGGIMTWNSELGYTPPCMVYYNGVYYVGVASSGPETDAGAITPGTDTDYWVTLWDYLANGQSFVTAGDTVTLTGDITGSGTFDDDGNVTVETTNTTASQLGTSTVGSTTQGIYLSSGTAAAMTGTVGSGRQPVYLKSGVVTESTSTEGGTAQGVYLNAGTLTALSDTVGSGTKPIYLSSGTATASTSTVGSGTKPIYLSSGTLTASSSTIGGTAKPVYLNSGTITALSSTVGSGTKPVYMSSGTITASSSTVGTSTKPIYMSSGTLTASSSTVGSGTKPIYMSSGTLTASSSTVGDSSTPVYLKSGVLTECSGGIGVSAYKKAATGYINFACGIIIQWGAITATSDNTDVTFPLEFPSLCASLSLTQSSYGSNSQYNIGYKELTTTGFILHANSGARGGSDHYPLYYIAIGY